VTWIQDEKQARVTFVTVDPSHDARSPGLCGGSVERVYGDILEKTREDGLGRTWIMWSYTHGCEVETENNQSIE
jgi:hypothetical protein